MSDYRLYALIIAVFVTTCFEIQLLLNLSFDLSDHIKHPTSRTPSMVIQHFLYITIYNLNHKGVTNKTSAAVHFLMNSGVRGLIYQISNLSFVYNILSCLKRKTSFSCDQDSQSSAKCMLKGELFLLLPLLNESLHS